MNSFNSPHLLALLLLIPPAGEVASRAKEAPMQAPLTIDLQAHPNLQFRIDAFTVPAASRAEFEAAMHRNLAFIQTLPGFINHMVFEKTSGPTTFNIVTVAVWESPEAIAAAGEKVRAYYQSIGFDMQGMLARLGITASLGYYRAPPALQ
jgi:heme-degrading monooxygenase HmoA